MIAGKSLQPSLKLTSFNEGRSRKMSNTIRFIMRKASSIIVSVFLISAPAWAKNTNIDLKPLASQQEFRDLSADLGLAISYLPAAPAEPLGLLGFDIGIEVTAVDIREDQSFWTKVTTNPPNYLYIPKLHLQKGLPFGFDIGAIYANVPQSNISLSGGEIKWAFISGHMALPALAIRGSYTRLSGVPGLELETMGADISISKGFAFVTPYAGVGLVSVESEENLLPTIERERFNLTKTFIGVKTSLLVLNFVAEASFSKIPLYTARLNIGF